MKTFKIICIVIAATFAMTSLTLFLDMSNPGQGTDADYEEVYYQSIEMFTLATCVGSVILGIVAYHSLLNDKRN